MLHRMFLPCSIECYVQKAAQEFNDINFHDLDGDGGLLVTGVDEDGGNIIH